MARVLIERLYAMSGMLNDKGQSVFYGKVGGTVVTGNEDGIKHAAMTVGYALNHLGFTIPPQADCGWIGEAGPGPSYGDEDGAGGRVGFDNEFTQRNTTIMTWNLMHLAAMLKRAGGAAERGQRPQRLGGGRAVRLREPRSRDSEACIILGGGIGGRRGPTARPIWRLFASCRKRRTWPLRGGGTRARERHVSRRQDAALRPGGEPARPRFSVSRGRRDGGAWHV